jgi:hypothetical protein
MRASAGGDETAVAWEAKMDFMEIDVSFLELIGRQVVNQPITLEHDQTKRTYLHPIEGSEAAKIGVRLFKNLTM